MKQLCCIFLLALTTSVYTSDSEEQDRRQFRIKLHETIKQKRKEKNEQDPENELSQNAGMTDTSYSSRYYGDTDYYLNRVADLLAVSTKDVNHSCHSKTPLIYALETFNIINSEQPEECLELIESYNIVCSLLENKAAANTSVRKTLNTPLHIVCNSRCSVWSEVIIQTLINNHTSPKDAINALNSRGESPLMLAIKSEYDRSSLYRLFRHGGILTKIDLRTLKCVKNTESFKEALSIMAEYESTTHL